MVWNLGNKNHAEWVKDKFSFINPSIIEKENKGWGDVTYSVTTKSHMCLKPYYEMVWRNGKKIFNKEVFEKMNSIGWGVFYSDDGHLDKRNKICFLHTESFSYEENIIISNILSNFIGVENGVSVMSYEGGVNKKTYYCLRLKKGASYEFIKKINKYMADGLEYKKM